MGGGRWCGAAYDDEHGVCVGKYVVELYTVQQQSYRATEDTLPVNARHSEISPCPSVAVEVRGPHTIHSD